MHKLLASLCVLSLAACSPQAQDQLARNAARSAIAPVVAERLPGVPVQTSIDCIIDNASAAQITALATDSVLGATETTVQTVNAILSKPETLTCLGTRGLPELLAGING